MAFRLAGVGLSLLLCMPLGAQTTSQSAASQAVRPVPGSEAPLVAQSLDHQAQSLGHQREEKVAARAARIRLLLEQAHLLAPDNPRINRDLLDLYEGLNDTKASSVAAAQYLRARPEDYGVFLKWLFLAQAMADTAPQRIEFLSRISQLSGTPRPVAAAAQVQLAEIYLRQGEVDQAKAACAKALEWDPYLPEAIQRNLQFQDSPSPLQSFQAARTEFTGNPRDAQTCWRMAQILQSCGLYEPAGTFFELCQTVRRGRPLAIQAGEAFLVDYVNSLLDQGKAQAAIDAILPSIKSYAENLALRSLLVEAYRMQGQEDKAKAEITAMAAIYRQVIPTGKEHTATQDAELAWFDYQYQNRPADALLQAHKAGREDANDPFVQRVLGACELAVGTAEEGEKLLRSLADSDAMAATILAKKLLEQKQADAAKEVILQAPAVRTGPGWRALAALAAANQVEIPAPARAAEIAKSAQEIPAYLAEMAQWPDKFLQVRLSSPSAESRVGEGLTVTVEIRNIGDVPVSLGSHGLIVPSVLLSLKAEGVAKGGDFPNLAAVQVPAPRYLEKGQSVSETIRLDLGPAERLLMTRPLGDISLTVSGMVDPVSQQDKMNSSAPSMSVEPLKLRRVALTSAGASSQDVVQTLGYIVRDLQQGDLAAQMLAARQTAALLAYARQTELDKALPAMPEGLNKPILLSMLHALLTYPAPGVRAEAVASLKWVDLDSKIIAQLGANVEDPSSLVRMLLAELLASKQTVGSDKLLRRFAQDSDPFVAGMAGAFLAEPK